MRPWLFLALLLGTAAQAHSLTPSLYELREHGAPGQVEVLWRTPGVEGSQALLTPLLPQGCVRAGPSLKSNDGLGDSERFTLRCDASSPGLAGRTIGVAGIRARSEMDVLVRVELADGRSIIRVLRAQSPSLVIPATRSHTAAVRDYFLLGVEHILTGFDHLLFVLGLLLLVRSVRSLVAALTAFTVAHSITLTAAVCGWVHFPTRAGEAIIALSIVFLALELTRRKDAPPTLGQRRPWLVAFAFGLVHGFGFAGALREVGLPASDVPLALFGFNLGVEAGQLFCVALALTMATAARRLAPRFAQRAPRALAYAMGSVAFCWLLQRLWLVAAFPAA